MSLEKLPSGHYRLRKMVDGKLYTRTFDHKPNQSECEKAIASCLKDKPTLSMNGTVRQCVKGYMESKSNVLSPSTIKGYTSMFKQIDDSFMDIKMEDLTLPMLQNEVNRYAQDHSPISVSNYSGFLTSVSRLVGLGIQSPTLPTKERSVAYIPSKNDIKRIVDYFKDTEYEVAILLTLYGLRRSELMALTLDDLSGSTLTINKAKVEALKGEWITKTTKTTDSTREVIISDELADKIRKQGYIYRRSVGYLRDLLYKAQSDLDIPHFPLHKMRHFFASYMHDQGYSDQQIMSAGGWKTNQVMRSVYQHALDIQDAKQNMASDIASLTE